MRTFITAFLLCFLTHFANSQERLTSLKTKLLEADTVLIVSHQQTHGIVIRDEKTGKDIPLPKLVTNNRPNREIIYEERVITDTALHRLTQILTRPFEDTEIEKMMCFMPHHAILIIKNNKTSFIDICFGCLGIETSQNIKMTANDIDKRKWTELEAFFLQQNIKYKLVKESEEE